MNDRIHLIGAVRNGKVARIYFAHNQRELDGITKGLHYWHYDTETIELTDTLYHSQIFDIDKRKRKETKPFQPATYTGRVKCMETGEVAVNAKQLAEYMGLTSINITESITKEKKVRGYTFIHTNEPLTIQPKEIVHYKRRTSWPGAFKVRCIETDTIFDCVRDAANDMKIQMQQIYNSIRSGKPYMGYTFAKG